MRSAIARRAYLRRIATIIERIAWALEAGRPADAVVALRRVAAMLRRESCR